MLKQANNFACLKIDIRYIFIKYLFRGKTELYLGEDKRGGEKKCSALVALAIQRPVGL